MFKGRLMHVVIGVCVLAVLAGGCRWPTRKHRAGAGPGTDVLTPTEAGALPDRTYGGKLIAGQFEAALFDYDSAVIKPSEQGKLDAVAAYLKNNPAASIMLEGHCDERGSREYNMALGERRALSARAYLISVGVDGSRLQTVSYGEERPKDPGHDESAWRLNRRVEFSIVQ